MTFFGKGLLSSAESIFATGGSSHMFMYQARWIDARGWHVIYKYIEIYTHRYIYIYIDVHLHQMNRCISIAVFACVNHIYIYIYIYIRMCVDVYTYMHVTRGMCVYMYMYVHRAHNIFKVCLLLLMPIPFVAFILASLLFQAIWVSSNMNQCSWLI